MEFRIADTFTDSLSRLTTEEQKAVKTTAFDLQLNPAVPGMNFHKIDSAKDPNFWSVRVNADIWLIVHKSASSLHRTSLRSGFYHHGTERECSSSICRTHRKSRRWPSRGFSHLRPLPSFGSS